MDNESLCPKQSMTAWVSEETPKEECRPCLLGPVVQWYQSELQEQGQAALAQGLESLTSESVTSTEIAQALDKLKEQVSPELAARLREFDCSVQAYNPEKNPEKEGGDLDEVESAGH